MEPRRSLLSSRHPHRGLRLPTEVSMADRSFNGCPPETFGFLEGLKQNNNNAWFAARPGKGFAIPKEAHNPAFVNWCAKFFEGMIPLNA